MKPREHVLSKFTPQLYVKSNSIGFLQSVTNNIGDAFAVWEKILQETFLPCLFFGESKSLTPLIGTLSTMPVKKDSLGFQNTVTSVNENFLRLRCARMDLV